MKKLLVAATGSVAIVKLEKTLKLLEKHFEIKLIVSNYVLDNYPEIKKLNPIIEDTSLHSFPKHIEISKWADQILVLPATANTIAKYKAAIADNPLLSTLIAARQKLIFVPAMNTFMYKSLCERNIISDLERDGHLFIGPADGPLREGESGIGRMVEPEEIAEVMVNLAKPNGKKVFIPYGASRVWIDDVRFITNNSTGTMARALAKHLRINGFEIEMVDVANYTNKELIEKANSTDFDIYISVAALADIDVDKIDGKIKKDQVDSLKINFKKNVDVISAVREKNKDKKFVAFKYDEIKENAHKKLQALDLDMIVWNKIGSMGNSKVDGAIITKTNEVAYESKNKDEIAQEITKELKLWTK